MLSIIIPAHFEDKNIVGTLGEIEDKVMTPHEILVVYDLDGDPTIQAVKKVKSQKSKGKSEVILVKNFVGSGRGVINAFKSGIKKAKADVIVVIMADLSDDIGKIDTMYKLMKKGY